LKDTIADFFNQKCTDISDSKDSLSRYLSNTWQDRKVETIDKIEEFEKFVILMGNQSKGKISSH
jgi:hypothetical protein